MQSRGNDDIILVQSVIWGIFVILKKWQTIEDVYIDLVWKVHYSGPSYFSGYCLRKHLPQIYILHHYIVYFNYLITS